jgi:Anti-sigma-K factor rskA/Putative zinc-finger
MLTNDHPQDAIPAFVLGTLDVDEVLLVNAHVVQCPACRAEMETFQTVLGALPYAATPRQPPAHIKQQLLARIAATTPAASHPARAIPRWMQAITGGALALLLACGVMLYDTNSRVASIGSEVRNSQLLIAEMTDRLTQDQQALVRLQERIAQDQQITMFIAAPQTIHRALDGSNRRAHATIYMQPDNTRAVLVIEGMPRAEPGTIYQLWLAKPGLQVPSTTFDVTDDGLAVLWIKGPAPINHYNQVMVTIEQGNGATLPSHTVVLSGSLSTALPASTSRAD